MPRAVEIAPPLFLVAGHEQGDAEVVAGKPLEAFRAEKRLENLRRRREASEGQVNLGAQESQIFLQVVRDSSADALKCV